MKKFTLIILLGILSSSIGFSQYRKINTQAFSANEALLEYTNLLKLENNILTVNPSSMRSMASSFGTIVGVTAYDYHSNSSIDSKVSVDANGDVSVVWTKGLPADPNGATRRIGYNFFDASAGTWGGEESVGANRRGWPSIPSYEGTTDLVLSHAAPLQYHTRATAGTGTWTDTDLAAVSGGTFAGTGAFVSSAATGDTLHLFYESDLIQGVTFENGFLYARSPDNGATWDQINVELPGMDTVSFINGHQSADTYVSHARGDVVAVVSGGWDEHIHLWKSTDRGQNWVHNYIFIFDTLFAQSDGAGGHVHFTTGMDHAVAVDKNGKVHVAAGMVAVPSLPGEIGGGTSFFAFNPGLIYWNEDYGFDLYLDDSVTFDTHVLLDFVDENGDGINSTTMSFDSIGRISNCGVITNPGVSVADDGTVILTWNAPNEAAPLLGVTLLPSNFDGLSRYNRDLYALASLDGGATWVSDSARNIADDIDGVGGGLGTITEEETHNFAYQTIGSDSLVHLLFQSSDQGGGNLINGAGTHIDKSMVHYSFPYWKVTGVQPISGLSNNVKKNVRMVIFPNPANDHVSLNLNLKTEAEYSLSLSNLLGQKLMDFEISLEKGKSQVDLDLSKFDAGIYLISLQSDNNAITRKLVIE